MVYRSNPPPTWPPPPPNWVPPPGWQPDPTWPPPPPGWQLWVEERANQSTRQDEDEVLGTSPSAGRVSLFGARRKAQALEEENAWLRTELKRLGALRNVELRQELAQLERAAEELRVEHAKETAELVELRQEVVETRDAIVLQEVGVYQYHHPLETSVQYKTQLADVQYRMKALVQAGKAVESDINFTFNNSRTKGRKVVSDLSRLMLRAYNAEAENALRVLKRATCLLPNSG